MCFTDEEGDSGEPPFFSCGDGAGQIVAPGDQRRKKEAPNGSRPLATADGRSCLPLHRDAPGQVLARPDARPALVAPKPAGLDLDTPSPVSYRSIIGHAPASLRPWLRLQSVYNGSLTLGSGTAFGSPRWYRSSSELLASILR